MRTRSLSFAILLSLVAGAAQAEPAALEARLQRVAAADGDVYLTARDALIAGASTEELRARVRSARWTDATWRLDAAAAIALAPVEKPGAERLLDELPGLTPARYLMKRRPEPEALRDLRALLRRGALSAPHLAERLLETRSLGSSSSPDAFPEALRKEAPRLIAEERAALLDGLVLALGGSGHPIAPFALRELALDESVAARHRSLAASALGQTRSPLALAALERLLASDDAALREGAVIGLGKLSSLASVERLRAIARDPAEKGLRVPALIALGRAGSRSAHRAAPSADSERIRELAALALVDALATEAGEREVRAALEGLSAVAHEGARAALVERISAARAPAQRARLERGLRRLDLSLARAR